MSRLQGFYVLLLPLLLPIQILADQVTEGLTVTWFDDYDCKKTNGIFAPPKREQVNSCHQLGGPTPHSFLINENSGPCAVVFYGDPMCTFNAAKAPVEQPLGSCVSSAHLFGFALECGSSPSTSSGTTAPSKATASSSKTASSSPASAGGSGGLGTTGTIAIGVILPAVSIIVAIIFGVRMWNSGIDRRKAKGFVEIQMDNRGEASTAPKSEGSSETKANNKNGRSTASGGGFSEVHGNESHSPSKNVTGVGSNPWEPHSSKPNEFGILPRYATNDFSTMPTTILDNHVRGREDPPTMQRGFAELPMNDPGGYSTVSTGYAEPPMNDRQGYPAMPRGAAEPSMSNMRSHSALSGEAVELPTSSTGGHSTMARGVAELPVNLWQGHPSTPRGRFVELPTDQREDHTSGSQGVRRG